MFPTTGYEKTARVKYSCGIFSEFRITSYKSNVDFRLILRVGILFIQKVYDITSDDNSFRGSIASYTESKIHAHANFLVSLSLSSVRFEEEKKSILSENKKSVFRYGRVYVVYCTFAVRPSARRKKRKKLGGKNTTPLTNDLDRTPLPSRPFGTHIQRSRVWQAK